MAKAEEKSEKEEINYIKSFKKINDNSIHLTHENGVEYYELNDISEIELDYLKKPSDLYFSVFLGLGLLFIMVITFIAAFFNVDPKKNYFEEFWMYFPFGILLVYLGIYLIANPVFNFLLYQNDIIGRKLTIYSFSKGKKEYKIGCWDYENVMSDNFFQVLFLKSTKVNNILKIDNEKLNDSFRSNVDYKNESWKYNPVGENYKLSFVALISVLVFTIWYINVPSKLELIPLFCSNGLLLIFEIVEILQTKKRIKSQKNNKFFRYDIFLKIYDNPNDITIGNNEELIFSGSIKEAEINAWNIGVNFKIEKNEHLIYLENDVDVLFSGNLNLITSHGVAYFLNEMKNKNKWIYIFKKL
jgi:hypothetical protein